ncbi:NAD/NADP octopine/nopaline dehydrogenase family protein [Cereibacter sp. SYSU M97828]|nr:NAD/NADP octopine/nopaline dehydrogenase family protein [Cereibacter flavus]
MKVAILGAGAAAFALAVLLKRDGHDPVIWSPSGEGSAGIATTPIRASGVIEGEFAVTVASKCADAIKGASAVIVALPAMGHRRVMDAAAPHLGVEQVVIISAHISFGALYLDELLTARGLKVPIVAWNTTLLRSRKPDSVSCRIATLRKRVDIAVLPTRLADRGLAACTALFGDRFNLRSDLLAVSLSNVNAQGHMALCLANFTRMELGEVWDQSSCSTPAIARLVEAIDAERVALAAAFGVEVRSAKEHKLQTHGAGATAAAKIVTYGPASVDSRYTLEDVPYGLIPTIMLGRLTGTPTHLHQAGVDIFSALYGRDFSLANDLFSLSDTMTAGDFQKACQDGLECL